MSSRFQYVQQALTRARIARYQRRLVTQEFALRSGQDHIERLRVGIKGNIGGLNGRWT